MTHSTERKECELCHRISHPVVVTYKKIKTKSVLGTCDVCGGRVENKKWNLCHNCYSRLWKSKVDYNRVYMREWRRQRKITT